MKRVLQFSEWLTNEVLENVIHQQYVFTIPKIIRPYFKYESSWGSSACVHGRQLKNFLESASLKGLSQEL
jgi:hypothetical protein